MRWLAILAVVVAGYLVFLVVLSALSRRPPRGLGLDSGRLRPCPRSTNCVCSQDGGPSGRAPWRYEGAPEDAYQRLAAILEAMPHARIVERQAPGYLRAEFRTPGLRFVDDFEALIEPGGTIHYRSASRVGLADRGMNRRRVRAIEARWREVSAPR